MKYLLYRSLMAMMMLNHDNKDIDYSNKYFTIHALSDGDVILYTPSSYTSGSLAYSINDGDWVSFNSDTTLSLAIEDTLKIKCITDAYKRSTVNTLFNFTGEYEVYGNVMSLLYGDDFQVQTVLITQKSLQGLLYQETTLKSAKNLILPATTLTQNCYDRMFFGCKSLTTAPQLPATTLTEYCYAGMFSNCTSLTEAPQLPATILTKNCYDRLFMGCTSLNEIIMLATDISASNCLNSWVYGVAPTGTFIKSGIEIPIGSSGIPTGWTVQVVTPSISNTLSTPIDFNYNEGVFTPIVTVELTKIMSEENILSLQPMCDITINVINKDNTLHTSDYLWLNTKTLSYVIRELNISNINDITIVIVDADIPEDSGDYYYGVEKNIHIPISFSNDIQCSINGSDWRWLNGNTVLTNEETEPFVDGNYFAIETNEGDIYKFKGNLTPTSSNGIGTFTISKKCNVKGNVMSLLYRDNFEGQTDLSDKDCAFYKLFYNCTNIVDASELVLPATTLAEYCYSNMFYGCTSLTKAPELSATTLAGWCYAYMFDGCSSLTTAPELPATTLANNCYTDMFSGCTGLTESPALPVTTLANGCYGSMFYGCTGLTSTPELPATTLVEYCYYNMFYGCKNLTTAPELPATTLAENCYRSMFYGCKNLTTAPELPATTLVEYCYYNMFYGCSKLNNITMLATDISADGCLSNWVYGVASSGTFIKNASMTSLPRGIKGIPDDWRVVNYGEMDYFAEYFTIEALEDGLTVSLSQNASQYRIDDGEWVSLSSNTITPSIDTGQKISFKNTNPTISSSYGIGTFTVNKAFNVEGNIMSLLYGDNFEGENDLTGKDYAFRSLFQDCTTLQNAKNLILIATTLAGYCYYSMFRGCTSLTTAPELPATTLTNECYDSMFFNCTSLTTAPALPATTLANYCYYSMFRGCTGLTESPALPATTLVNRCYSQMFQGCSKLNKITMLATDISVSQCLTGWVSGVASSGTFIKNSSMTSLKGGVSGIPSNWTVQDYSA